MKKRVIFMMINMNVGGTEKALLNMISEIPKENYEITILMLEQYGDFLNSIPEGVHVEYLEGFRNIKNLLYDPPKKTANHFLRRGKIIKSFNILFLHFLSKLFKDRSVFFNYVLSYYPVINNQYDIAVAYAGPMDFISYFVLKRINANKRIQWVHFDVTKTGFNPEYESKHYHKFDKIFVVSNEGKDKLINMIPTLNERTEVFPNIISPKLIYKQAKDGIGFKDDFDGLRILTVGRLTSEKGQDIAIRVFARLIREGYRIRWYCVGEGNARKKYEELIDEYALQDNFILLGADPNPYSYIAQCDIYVQPSRHEGYCISLAEARCLKKPIVATDFTGAREQIRNGETGFVVQNDENEIYQALIKLINDPGLRRKFQRSLEDERFDALEMNKIYNLI